jgi:pimeloyl-ACP methyl ester carboxylesterase
MARKFLYLVAFCIVVALIGRIGWELFKEDIAAFALVPSAEFTPTKPLELNAYQDPGLWYSRPGIGAKDPARWLPSTAKERSDLPTPDDEGTPDFAVFFVHPTSFLSRDAWNAPLGDTKDADADRIARIYVRGMASPFNAASEIWAPKYRQATMGAFLTDAPEGQKAIDAAYADVREAYRFFLETLDDDTPIVLVGHSQGALHLLRLLREEIKGSPVADRIVASYAIGWPISVEHDLPAMGIPACATKAQTGCVLSWSSFAEPADPAKLMKTYAKSIGFDGKPRGDSKIVCTNPLTGAFGGAAPASANRGTLVPDETISKGELVPDAIPARCDDRGLLLIGDPPDLGAEAGLYVLPGNNYHVFDIPLFWANTRADVGRRVDAWVAARTSAP